MAHKLLKICQSAKYFGQQEKEDQSQLHILWGPTFQAPKHIQLVQHLTWARSKSLTKAIQYEAQHFSWLASEHFVTHGVPSSEIAWLTGQK